MSKSILYCKCIHSEYFSLEDIAFFESILKSAGNDIYIVDDLCGAVTEKKNDLFQYLMNQELTVIACHPRSVRWLLASMGVANNILDSIHYFNINKDSWFDILKYLSCHIPDDLKYKITDIMKKLNQVRESFESENNAETEKNMALSSSEKSKRPWFPVIDYANCKQCGACIDFCLFGVYGKNEKGEIRVESPKNCKDNCPACARVCPHNAIIFPKYNKAPINGDLSFVNSKTKHKPPIFSLSGDELYDALSQRKNKSHGLYKK